MKIGWFALVIGSSSNTRYSTHSAQHLNQPTLFIKEFKI